jgi:hypothetical protein
LYVNETKQKAEYSFEIHGQNGTTQTFSVRDARIVRVVCRVCDLERDLKRDWWIPFEEVNQVLRE